MTVRLITAVKWIWGVKLTSPADSRVLLILLSLPHSWLCFIFSEIQTQLFLSQVPTPAEARSSQTRRSTLCTSHLYPCSRGTRPSLCPAPPFISPLGFGFLIISQQLHMSKCTFFPSLPVAPGDWMMKTAPKWFVEQQTFQ